MAVTLPRTDILSSAAFRQAMFTLPPTQRFSVTEGGSLLAEESTSALWQCMYETVPMLHTEAVTFEAKLRSLAGMVHGFYAYDLRRPYPAAYPDGVFSDTGTIHTLGSDNKSMRIDNLPANFQLSVGDYLAFDYGDADYDVPDARALHQVMEDVTASGAGLTASFEVYPPIRDNAAVGAAVTLKTPSALFVLTPENFEPSIQDVMFGSVSFKGIQYLP